MKSSPEQLANRGYLDKDASLKNLNFSIEELLDQLKHSDPVQRTLSARLLSSKSPTEKVIHALIDALKVEKKLYSKLEISETLTSFGRVSVEALIPFLGSIGNNQHKIIPEKKFKKDSYPLPRDIVARIIAHVGPKALPCLLDAFPSFSVKQQLEAIDAIGFICFYNPNSKVLQFLLDVFHKNSFNRLLQWKIVIAFSAFPGSVSMLNDLKTDPSFSVMLYEIERSLEILRKND